MEKLTNTHSRINPADYGITLLRIALATMFLAHGLLKVLVFTLPGTAGFFESVGFPGFLADIVAPAETIAGIALLIGLRTRFVAIAMIPLLLGATVVHAGNGWVFGGANGGWEYQAYLVIAALAQSLLGSGVLSPDKKRVEAV